MPQIRVKRDTHYTAVNNGLVQNPEISLKAKGLLIYMLSLPGDWDYSISGLSVKCKEGKSSIRSAISELIEHGYITRSLTRSDDGTISGYEYVVYEAPQPSCGFPTTDNPSSENPSSENPSSDNPSSENPSSENPSSENPSSENRTQQINNLTKEKRTNPPYSPPNRGSERKRFIPPSVDEVRAYCLERKNGIDPEAFVAFYASKGWMVGRSPMKDWKAAVHTWERKRAGPVKEKDDHDDWFR